MADPQANAYDDFDEDPETVFRIFDEGEKFVTNCPDWRQDDSLTEPEIRQRMTAEGWQPVKAVEARLLTEAEIIQIERTGEFPRGAFVVPRSIRQVDRAASVPSHGIRVGAAGGVIIRDCRIVPPPLDGPA